MIGRTISHYRIVATLGSGGMGVVYKAEDLRLGRMVALKMLSDHLSDRTAIERFEREARAASALNHPNICTIHEIDEVEGKPFIVMELLEGLTLKDLLENGPLPKERLLELSIELTDALATAHAARIIHRDLKPANLFVTKLGHLKILDFGLAKLLPRHDDTSHAETTQRDLTASHVTVGTLGYMSPEQLRGDPLDARTDLYSLGVVLKEAAPSPAFEPIINKATEKDRELRYQSAADVRADLKRLKSEPPKKRLPWGAATAGGVLLIAVIAVFAIIRGRESPATVPAPVTNPPPSIRTLAVLPFKPIIAKERDEALELGIADTLIAKISNIRGLTVRPLTAVRRYTGLEQDAVEAGRQLGVDAVLDGTTHNEKNKVRVTARLIRVSDSSQLWSGQYDTTFADIFSIYDAISGRLAGELSLKLTPTEQREVHKRDTKNAEAYRAYLLGRYYASKIGRVNFEKAIDQFKNAVALDPEYALAYVGLANTYTVMPISADFLPGPPLEAARSAAQRAIALDPSLAEAYTALGWSTFWYEEDWARSETLYRKSIALNPNYPSAHLFYGALLSSEGRIDDALREVEVAQRLDPLSIQANIIKGHALYAARRYDAAIDHLKRTLEIDPNAWVPHLIIGKAYEQKKAYAEAIAHYRTSWANSFGSTEPLGRLGHVYAVSGDTAGARKVLAELTGLAATRYVPASNIAVVHVGLGESDQAIRLLERACQEHDVRLMFLRVERAWDPIRGDPRFSKIVSCLSPQP